MAWNEKPFLKLYYYENDSFHLDAIIDDYKDCSFSRNLFEAGEFTITINMNIPNAKKFKMGMFVQFGSDPYDVGEIKSVSDSLTETGKGGQVLTITGYDARIIFQKRIIKNMNANGKWEMTGAGELIIRSLVRDQCGEYAEAKRRLPVINEFPADFNFKGDSYSISETYGNLYDVLCTIATNSKLGWRMKMTSSGFTLETYEGNDLSKTVKFSPEYDSLASGSFSESSENFTNAVYVGGKGDDDDRDIYEGEAGSPTGLDRVECWDDKSDLTTTEEYANEALSILNSFSQTLSVSAQGLAKNPYEYKKQYDVGDYIMISFNDKTAVCQIISVSENWSKGAYGIDFEFGKPLSTLGGQLNAMLQMIHRASDKGSSTDSVRWYTIPTDTEMPSSDVTYRTIGFIGDAGSGATFKLYLDDQRNGAKTYHVYVKQLAGSGKLTLTTGREGAMDLPLNPGTYVTIIYVDENGNVSTEMPSAVSTTSTESATPEQSTREIQVTVSNFTSSDLVMGKTVKIKFSKCTADKPTLNINGTGAKAIKAVKAGSLVDVRSHTARWEGSATSSVRTWDDNTVLELMYDGTQWVIVGNPILCSYYTNSVNTSSVDINSYEVYANGMIYQYGTFDTGSNVRILNAVINFLIPFVTTQYVVNFVTLAPAGLQHYVGAIGAMGQTTSGVTLHYYGLTTDLDVARYIKWEARGF